MKRSASSLDDSNAALTASKRAKKAGASAGAGAGADPPPPHHHQPPPQRKYFDRLPPELVQGDLAALLPTRAVGRLGCAERSLLRDGQKAAFARWGKSADRMRAALDARAKARAAARDAAAETREAARARLAAALTATGDPAQDARDKAQGEQDIAAAYAAAVLAAYRRIDGTKGGWEDDLPTLAAGGPLRFRSGSRWPPSCGPTHGRCTVGCRAPPRAGLASVMPRGGSAPLPPGSVRLLRSAPPSLY